jgi:hypothetical protein
MASKRYTIIIADRSSGVVRRLTLSLRPLFIGAGVVASLPVLIGIGAAWKAKSDVANLEASHRAMEEVSGPIIAIALVLCAVFVPVAFLGGIAGQLYRQFAVTLTFAVVISGFIALTLTPALCAILMKSGHHEARVFHPFNVGFAWVTRRFLGGVNLLLRHPVMSLIGFVGVLAVAGFGIAKYLLPYLFRIVAKAPELVLVSALGWCFFLAGVASLIGLSREMGHRVGNSLQLVASL